MAYSYYVRIGSQHNMGRRFFVDIYQNDVTSASPSDEIIALVDSLNGRQLMTPARLVQVTSDKLSGTATSFEVQVRNDARAKISVVTEAGETFVDDVIVGGSWLTDERLYFRIVPNDGNDNEFRTTLTFEA